MTDRSDPRDYAVIDPLTLPLWLRIPVAEDPEAREIGRIRSALRSCHDRINKVRVGVAGVAQASDNDRP